jgi:NO-binding membrane sensor protein with MHYT domain
VTPNRQVPRRDRSRDGAWRTTGIAVVCLLALVVLFIPGHLFTSFLVCLVLLSSAIWLAARSRWPRPARVGFSVGAAVVVIAIVALFIIGLLAFDGLH